VACSRLHQRFDIDGVAIRQVIRFVSGGDKLLAHKHSLPLGALTQFHHSLCLFYQAKTGFTAAKRT
jgi:hypothetical protein